MIPKKKKILLLVESSTSYGRDILQGISQYAKEQNNWLFHLEPRGINEDVPMLNFWKGDGIISRVSEPRVWRQIHRLKCPIIDLLYQDKQPIGCDETMISRQAFTYFKGLGFEYYGFFSFGESGWIRDRKEEYIRQCEKNGITPHVFETRTSKVDSRPEPTWSNEYESTLIKWLRELPKPIALMTANDHQAVFLMNFCRELNISVPDSIAIMGVNNDKHLCDILTPTLSSIDQNAKRIGYEVARLLDQKMEDPNFEFKELLIEPLGVVPRGSTETLVTSNEDVTRAFHFIKEYATRGIRVADVLDEIQISSKSLERWFQKLLGHTPEKEIILTKLKYAESLLKNTNFSTRRIAELSGFATEQYFFQVFRREMGLTPSKYRKAVEGIQDELLPNYYGG